MSELEEKELVRRCDMRKSRPRKAFNIFTGGLKWFYKMMKRHMTK